jgi:hypothetical protein
MPVYLLTLKSTYLLDAAKWNYTVAERAAKIPLAIEGKGASRFP